MAKLKNQAMALEDMEQVAGGTYNDSWQVADMLKQAGMSGMMQDETGLHVSLDSMRKAVQGLGFTADDHGGLLRGNTYKENATGKVYSQEEFVGYLQKKFPGVKCRNITDQIF